ncbi:MAG: hypothetical protein UT32_C0014G0003 [Parcubacteria group bacterium GW2011_GWC2_39_14]|nr:MAG: hypothetical protein UT32_C0014G0003 [Parcubacteria group bacterium GW2011_GWC2_39_14]KKR54451.1 MAG: hypothetical protein UT91_C0015G0003 [Parcubacteria group bacterium GW2011_GWA2_40_23]
MGEKKSLEEKILNFEQKQNGWLEPMREWLKEAVNLPKIARESNLLDKKVVAKKIFGSNLRLTGGKVMWGEELATPYLLLGSEAKSPTFRFTHLRSQIKNGDTSPKKPWVAVAAAREKIGKIEDCLIVVLPRGIGPLFLG